MRRVMSLYLPRWAMERRGSEAGSAHKPAVQAVSIGNRRLVSAANPAAEAQGILPGLALADARAQLPGLAVAPADPAGDAAALLRLAQWCGRYSPWTVPDGLDGILLDITGCAHLVGGEDLLGAALAERLDARGITARIAIADTIGGAAAMARGGDRPVAVVPPGAIRQALAPLSVRVLRLTPETIAALERLGLRRIGDLYPLPRADLARRFGDGLLARLDAALGQGGETLSPLPPAPPRWVRRHFAEPIATPEAIAAATKRLLEALCAHLADDGLGARLLILTLYRLDGTGASLAIGTARPSRDADHLLRLFAERFDRVDPGLGIEDLVLTAKTVERLEARQLALPGSFSSSCPGLTGASTDGFGENQKFVDGPLKAGHDDKTNHIDETAILIDRLANRLGPRRVGRLVPHESHLPERAQRFLFAFVPMDEGMWDQGKKRPLRLLARPEPIEAVAPVPDDPPVMFRWRRRLHRVARAEGPERLLGEWWRGEREAQLLRDYYRVEDDHGRRYWLFRAGLYRPDARSRWFLHGLDS